MPLARRTFDPKSMRCYLLAAPCLAVFAGAACLFRTQARGRIAHRVSSNRAGVIACQSRASSMTGEGGVLPIRMRPDRYIPDRPIMWSNPLGLTLTQVREDVWLAERPFYPTLPGLQNIDVACKMVVVRLPDGKLWVHSPVGLDAAMKGALAKLGEVAHIITPNTEHMKWARQWIELFPSAASYACPGLRERKPEVGWQRSLEEFLDAGVTSTSPPDAWGEAIELCWIQDRWPLVSEEPFFSEVVFCHKPSRTLIVTDLWLNYPATEDVPAGSVWWKWVMEDLYRPVYNRFMRTTSWQESYDTIMAWDFEYIAPCHGEPIARDCKRKLAEWLEMPAGI